MKKSVLIVGGGTGGHISPGIALYEEFKKQNIPVKFLANKRDKRFSSLQDIAAEDLLLYSAPSFTKNIFKLPLFVFNFISSILKVKKYIKKMRIQAVIGMGGYVSAPALIAARMKKVHIYLCEQNSVPGKVTHWFEKHARTIYTTFDISREHLQNKDKIVNAGNPIREKVLSTTAKNDAKKTFHLGHAKKVILAIGGSQGAVSLNRLVFDMKKNYADEFTNSGIIWSTGDYSYETYKEKVYNEIDGGSVFMTPFINNVGMAYRACDVAISRAGSGAMMELAALGIPSILIPYPYAAGNHQDKNALEFEQKGAAVRIKESEHITEEVVSALSDLLKNPRALKAMSEKALAAAKVNAAGDIVADIMRKEFSNIIYQDKKGTKQKEAIMV